MIFCKYNASMRIFSTGSWINFLCHSHTFSKRCLIYYSIRNYKRIPRSICESNIWIPHPTLFQPLDLFYVSPYLRWFLNYWMRHRTIHVAAIINDFLPLWFDIYYIILVAVYCPYITIAPGQHVNLKPFKGLFRWKSWYLQ